MKRSSPSGCSVMNKESQGCETTTQQAVVVVSMQPRLLSQGIVLKQAEAKKKKVVYLFNPDYQS